MATKYATKFHCKPVNENNPANLFHWYRGSNEPQPVMIAVDRRDGEVTCRYNPEVGNAVTPSEANGDWLMFRLNGCPVASHANNLIEAVVKTLNDVENWPDPLHENISEVVEGVINGYPFNTIHHLECERDEPMAVFDPSGDFIEEL